MKPIACLLLAAGCGSRFGGRKQLALIDGQPMVQHSLSQLKLIFGDDLYIVTGAYSDEVKPYIAGNAHVLDNALWESGIGTSISYGVKAISERKHYAGIMVALLDQVELKGRDYERICECFDGGSIVASQYNGISGVPAIFPESYFDELRDLNGDIGARKIIKRHAEQITNVAMPNAGLDIDTKQDLFEFQGK